MYMQTMYIQVDLLVCLHEGCIHSLNKEGVGTLSLFYYTVDGPVLLYHDEIPRRVGSNGLLCQSSENTEVA